MTPWTIDRQAPLSMGFPRQEYWSGLSFPSPGDLPNPGIKPESPESQENFFTTELQGEPQGRHKSQKGRLLKESHQLHGQGGRDRVSDLQLDFHSVLFFFFFFCPKLPTRVVHACVLSHVQLFATPRTCAYIQAKSSNSVTREHCCCSLTELLQCSHLRNGGK